MKIKSIKNLKNLAGKRVLLRSDFNVPLKNGKVLEDYKIIRNLPTINFLLEQKCKIIVIAHLGNPKAGVFEEKFSLKPVSKYLDKKIKAKVRFVADTHGFAAGTAVMQMKSKEILFLENLRFYEGEKKNSADFAKKLASLADVYVNDAFGVCHRADASVNAIKKYLPSYAGLLLENEVVHLEKIRKPKKPLVVIIGGAKLGTKIPLIKAFQKTAYRILVGGALANNFFAAHNYNIGRSLVDDESIKFAGKLVKNQKNSNIVLPIDVMVGSKKNFWDAHAVPANKVGDKDYILDIGPKTVEFYKKYIFGAATVVWNGPMGMFEEKKFRHGTLSIARSMSLATDKKVFCVAGGGETVEALKMTKTTSHINWLSTGGGAMLSYLAGEKMPGLSEIVY